MYLLNSPCLKGLFDLLNQNSIVAVWRLWERQDVVKPVKLGVSKQVGSDVAEHCSLIVFLLLETAHDHPQRGTEPSGAKLADHMFTVCIVETGLEWGTRFFLEEITISL